MALNFITTPLEMTKISAGSTIGRGLLLAVFQSLMLPKSLEPFVMLISVPTLPLGDNLLRSIGKEDGANLADIFMVQHQFSKKLSIDLINRVYWSRLLLSRQELPILTEKLLGHEHVWKLEEEFLADVHQLSSKAFCATIEEGWVMGDALWAIVDGECLASAQPYALQSFVFNLLNNEQGVENSQFNGLLPIIKFQQLLVAIKYLETLGPSSSKKLTNRVKLIGKEIIKDMNDHQLPDLQTAENGLFDMTLAMVTRALAHPVVKSKSKGWVEYFERVWASLERLEDRKLIGVIKHRALINCVCLAISIGLAEEIDAAGKIQKILVSPRRFVPNRDLYTLLIIMQASQVTSIAMESALVFWTLAGRNSSARSIMTVNSDHFGLLEGLSDNQSSIEAFRYHLWSSPKAHQDLRLARSMSVKFALADIFNHHFIAFHREFYGRPLLVPKLEIHPFVENRLSAVLRIAIMLRIRLDVQVHPLYFKLLFGQGHNHKVDQPELLRKLVQNIIARQFPCNLRSHSSTRKSLRQLDVLHAECMASNCIRGENPDDYADFLLESSRKSGFLENIWRIDGHRVAMNSILERMALQVWSTKYRPVLTKLDVGHMDLVGDTQYLFFGTK